MKFWTESPSTLWSKLRTRIRGGKNTTFECYVWCLSTGRVGTNTIAALGQLSPEILSVHEPKPRLFGLGKCAFDSKGDDRSAAIIAEALEACRCDLPFDGQNTYLETSPQVTFLARQLLQVFPKSKFLHIVRHPGDVVRSGMRRRWYAGNSADKWRIAPAEQDISLTNWERMEPFEKNIWLWAETNRWIVEFLSEIPNESKLSLKSEELFAGDETSLSQLFQFLDVAKPSDRCINKVLRKRLNAQKTGEYGSRDKWSPSQMAMLENIAGQRMSQFGYETPASE